MTKDAVAVVTKVRERAAEMKIDENAFFMTSSLGGKEIENIKIRAKYMPNITV
jgi:hypothetical protein